MLGNLAELMGPQPGLKSFSNIGVGEILDQALNGVPETVIEKTAFDFIRAHDTKEADELQAALDSLTFLPSETVKKADTGYHESPFQVFLGNDARKPLAYQIFETHTVQVKIRRTCNNQSNHTEIPCLEDYGIDELHEVAHVFLRIHEAYIRLEYDRGIDRLAAETYARAQIAKLVSDSSFEDELFSRVMQSSNFTLGMLSANYFHLWNELPMGNKKVFVDIFNPTPKQIYPALDAFVEAIHGVGLPCIASNQARRQFVGDYITLVHSDPLYFLDQSAVPVFQALCGTIDPEGTNNVVLNSDSSHPFLTIGSFFEVFHPSVSNTLYVNAVPSDSRCHDLALEVYVGNSTNPHEIVKIKGTTGHPIEIPMNLISTAQATSVQIHSSSCKYIGTLLYIFVKGSESETDDYGNLVATPGIYDNPSPSSILFPSFPAGAWSMIFLKNGND